MCNKGNNGFTLLELIIVIIVLGVLTSLALPRMFAIIAKVKANEAIKAIRLIDKGLQGCLEYGKGGGASALLAIDCLAHLNLGRWQALGINDPENESSSHFNYGLNGGSVASYPPIYFYGIQAISKSNPTDNVMFYRNNGETGAVGYCGRIVNISPAEPDIKILGCGAFRSLNITSDT